MGPTIDVLDTLASGSVRDRAFAAAEVRLRYGRGERGEIERVYEAIRGAADREHAGQRSKLRERDFERNVFTAELRAVPLEIRDHHVEEILGVAYPPLAPLETELTLDATSGLAEILFAVEEAKLGPETTFVDLGSGNGKVAILVGLLTGARAIGLEIDPIMVAHASRAATALALGHVSFVQADLRVDPLPRGDAYFMYVPFGGSAEVVGRLEAAQPLVLLSQALDLTRFPWLRARGRGSYWLEAYESSG